MVIWITTIDFVEDISKFCFGLCVCAKFCGSRVNLIYRPSMSYRTSSYLWRYSLNREKVARGRILLFVRSVHFRKPLYGTRFFFSFPLVIENYSSPKNRTRFCNRTLFFQRQSANLIYLIFSFFDAPVFLKFFFSNPCGKGC